MFRVYSGYKVASDFKTRCIVDMDNRREVFTDFVTVGYIEETGQTRLLQNADAITLGRALQMIALKFDESMKALSHDERELVEGILMGGMEH